MTLTRYKQQILMGDRLVGFRDDNDEPWIIYETDPDYAVLSFDAEGHYPQPEWKRREP